MRNFVIFSSFAAGAFWSALFIWVLRHLHQIESVTNPHANRYTGECPYCGNEIAADSPEHWKVIAENCKKEGAHA